MFLFFFITGLITSAFLNGYLFVFFKRKLYDPINVRSSHNEKATRSVLQFFLHFVFAMDLVGILAHRHKRIFLLHAVLLL